MNCDCACPARRCCVLVDCPSLYLASIYSAPIFHQALCAPADLTVQLSTRWTTLATGLKFTILYWQLWMICQLSGWVFVSSDQIHMLGSEPPFFVTGRPFRHIPTLVRAETNYGTGRTAAWSMWVATFQIEYRWVRFTLAGSEGTNKGLAVILYR